MKTRSFGILFAASISGTVYLSGQTISADITYIPTGGYYYSAENLTFIEGGSGAAFGGQGAIICFDAFSDAPAEEQGRLYHVVSPEDAFSNDSGAALGVSILYWFYDTYYSDIYGDPANLKWDLSALFQVSLWELSRDFDGTVASIDLATGGYTNGDGGELLEQIIANFDDISQGYTSTNYSLYFLRDDDSQYQQMLLVTPYQIPEPSTAALLGSMTALTFLSRKRRK